MTRQNYVVTNRIRAGRPNTRLSRCRARARSTRPWRSAVRRVGARECRSGWIVSHSQVVPNSNLKAYCDWLGLAGRREAIFVNIGFWVLRAGIGAGPHVARSPSRLNKVTNKDGPGERRPGGRHRARREYLSGQKRSRHGRRSDPSPAGSCGR